VAGTAPKSCKYHLRAVYHLRTLSPHAAANITQNDPILVIALQVCGSTTVSRRCTAQAWPRSSTPKVPGRTGTACFAHIVILSILKLSVLESLDETIDTYNKRTTVLPCRSSYQALGLAPGLIIAVSSIASEQAVFRVRSSFFSFTGPAGLAGAGVAGALGAWSSFVFRFFVHGFSVW